jgi:hypothetical protein
LWSGEVWSASSERQGGIQDHGRPSIAGARRRLDALPDEAHVVAGQASRRAELIALLEEGSDSLRRLAWALPEKTLVLR